MTSSVPVEENISPSDLELEAREYRYQASSECEEALNSLESTAAEDNVSSEPREYLESPKDGLGGCMDLSRILMTNDHGG